MSRLNIGFAAIGLGALCALPAGCRAGLAPEAGGHQAGEPARTRDSAAAARYATREPGALAAVVADSVHDWAGPGGRPFEVARRSAEPAAGHARRYGTITRSIALRDRTATLTEYPCESCHAGRGLRPGTRRIRDAHQEIQPVHPDRTGAACANCHATADVARLALESGELAPLDESYRLCGECHFPQVDAWAGGGHGKRLDGWQGRRIVMACTDCHDPHHPAVERRVPFRAPRLDRPRADGP